MIKETSQINEKQMDNAKNYIVPQIQYHRKGGKRQIKT